MVEVMEMRPQAQNTRCKVSGVPLAAQIVGVGVEKLIRCD
jgi:hypothetical protein